jgi:DNA invertase Pin-like site-specific DNA recombinase
VHAMVLGRRRLRRAPMASYLVEDPDKATPFWVGQEEVSRVHTPAGPEARLPGDRPEQGTAPPAQERPPDPPPPVLHGVRALGYVSVEENGNGETSTMREQAAAIDSLCRRRGWRLLEVVRDVDSGGGGERRPGLMYAMERIAKGEASCLVVSHVERLSHSAGDLGRIIEWLGRSGGHLVAIDVRLDTSSEAGRIAAGSLMRVGAWERSRMANGIRNSLAAARATGRPSVEDVPALKERIVEMRSRGMTLQAIADRLNEEGVPTLRGGQLWRPSSVQAAAGYRRPPRGLSAAQRGEERR